MHFHHLTDQICIFYTFCIEFIINKGISHLIEILGLLLHVPVEQGGGRGQGEILQSDVVHVVSSVSRLVLPLVTFKVSFNLSKGLNIPLVFDVVIS